MKRAKLLIPIIIIYFFVLTGFSLVNPDNPKNRQSYGINGNARSVDVKYFNTSERDSSYYKNEVYKFNRSGYCIYESTYHYTWGYPNYKYEYSFDSNNRLLSKRKYNHNNELVEIEVPLYSNKSIDKQLCYNSDSTTVTKISLYTNTKDLQVKEMFSNLDTTRSTTNYPRVDSIFNLNELVILKSYNWSMLSDKYKMSQKVVYDKDFRVIENHQVNRPDTKSIWFTNIDQTTGAKIEDCCDNWFLYKLNPKGKVIKEIQFDEQTQIPCIIQTYNLDKFGNPTDVVVENILQQISKIQYNYTYDLHGNWITREEIKGEKKIELITREIIYE